MADYRLNAADLALLRSPSQRYQLRCAILPAYTPTVTQWTRPVGSGRETFQWTPQSSLTSHTIGIVGTPVYYLIAGERRGGGVIGGENKTVDWGDGTGEINPADGLIEHTYLVPGTYEFKLYLTDPDTGATSTSRRWVRVYQDWGSAYDGIAEVQGFSGSFASGGWQVSLRVTEATGDYLTGDLPDRAGVILWLEQTWGVDDSRELGTQKTLGVSGLERTYDPRICFVGYVVGDTVRVDPETHDVTFSARTAEYFLQQMRITEQVYLDSSKSGFGHVIANLTIRDAVNHLMYRHTNYATWHSAWCWRETSPGPNYMDRITLNEGTIWQALSDCARNEFGRLQASRDSRVTIYPDLNIRGITWWGAMEPPEFPLDSQNILDISVDETPPDRVGYVELTSSDPFGGATLTARYPSSPGDVGDFDRREIICHSQANMDAWAERIYHADNARYRVRATTGMATNLGPGNVVVVDYADPQGRVDFTGAVGGGSYRMPFYVDDISYDVDLQAGTWKTTLTLAQIVRMRWNLTLDRWEAFDGSSWGAV